MTNNPPVMGFVKLVTNDIEGLVPFYTEVFDFKIEYRVTANEGDPDWGLDEILMHNARDEGTTLVLLSFHDRREIQPGGLILGMRVTDLAGVIDKAVAHGGTVVRPLEDMPEHGVKVAFLTDPRGTLLEVIELLPTS